MERDLLHELTKKVGCAYLSDLRFVADPRKIKSALELLSAKDYSLCQWKNAILYLVGEKTTITSCAEGKEILLENL